jgi:outer membrane protein OmpA-like peptidoglycan-associated protein
MMTKTAGLTTLALALGPLLGLGACATLTSPRDRIVQPAAICQDAVVPIYFQTGAAELTAESRRVIAAEAQRAKGCEVNSVSVVGLADAAGEPAANLELSQRRAQSVTAAVAAAGLPAAQFEVAAAGQAGAVTAQGQAAPLRRRAEITLKLSRPK